MAEIKIDKSDLEWLNSVFKIWGSSVWDASEEAEKMPPIASCIRDASLINSGFINIEQEDLLFAVKTARSILTLDGAWELKPEDAEHIANIEAAVEESKSYASKCGPFDASTWVRVLDVLQRVCEEDAYQIMLKASVMTTAQMLLLRKKLLQLLLMLDEEQGWKMLKDPLLETYYIRAAYHCMVDALKDYPEEIQYRIANVDPDEVWDNNDWQKVFEDRKEAEGVLADLLRKGVPHAVIMKTTDGVVQSLPIGYSPKRYRYLIMSGDEQVGEAGSYKTAKEFLEDHREAGEKNTYIAVYDEKAVQTSKYGEPDYVLELVKKLDLPEEAE